MQILKFEQNRDLDRLEDFLRDRYLENRTAAAWLPERLHDIIYRVGAQETAEGSERSADHMYYWEENGEIVACILPDGENIYVAIRSGYEHLFPSMIDFSEKNCLQMFSRQEDGSVKFWVAVCDSFPYMREELAGRGYSRFAEEENANCIFPQEEGLSAELPEGFRLMYGEEYPDEEKKWSALRLGFHPDWECSGYRADMGPYNDRKCSSMYPDSFECIVVDESVPGENDVCSYCYVYVDMRTKTALIESVSTREKYRRMGFGKAIMHAAVRRCRDLGVEKCYVDSFGWRRDFYTAAGFATETSVSFWYKILK